MGRVENNEDGTEMDVSKEAFIAEVMDSLKEYLPEEYAHYDIEIRKVDKTNRKALSALSLIDPERKKPGAVPVFYLDDYYRQYLEGEPLDEILQDLGDRVAGALSQTEPDIQEQLQDAAGHITDWDAIKDRIIMSAVGVSKNEELLKDRPHETMGDIASTYRIYLGNLHGVMGTIPVTNDLMGRWNITKEQLHQTALENSMAVLPARINGLRDELAELLGNDPEEGMQNEEGIPLMYVVSNKEKMLGAAVIFYPDVKDRIEALFPEGCFILPSSIHEVLLVPKGQCSVEDLEMMVRDVNRTQVAPEEVLSDLVHEYDPASRMIGLAGQDREFAEEQTMEIAKKVER